MKKLVRGMVKDSARVDQPEGTMRDALNANLNVSKGTVVNEYGTTVYPGNNNFRVFGNTTLDNDKLVLFGVDTVENIEQIRLLDTRNQDTIILYEDTNLNFKDSHPIVCVSRKNQANEHLVYFTDGYVLSEEVYPGHDNITESNPPRVINISRQLTWLYAGGLNTQLYDSVNTYKKLELIPHIGKHSTIDEVSIEAGGALPSGAYYLAIAYADKSGLETNYFTVANPVYLVPGDENSVPTNILIGAEGGTPTGKLIKWKLTIPGDVAYELIQPSIIRLINDEQVAFKLPALQLNKGGSMYVTYTGVEGALPISPEDIIVDDVHYASAAAIAQLDNRLYLGNVTSTKDIGFQPFAHHIKVAATVETIDNFNPRVFDTFILNQGYAAMLQTFDRPIGRQYFQKYTYDASTGYAEDGTQTPAASYAELLSNFLVGADGETLKGYRSPKYSFKKKSFRRGEVYSFYISFILKDGTETYAYHIPGRSSKELSGNASIEEKDRLDIVNDETMRTAAGFRPEEYLQQNKNAKIYQILDTSELVSDPDNLKMGYWENENESYPTTPDFLEGDVDSEGNVDIRPSILSGTRVRHHKFPSNLSSMSFIKRATNVNSYYTEEANKIPQGGTMSTPGDAGDNNGIALTEEIRLLGFKLKNLKLPRYILQQVQGYKIYYAKRSKENRTILGQGITIPGHPRYASVKEQSLAEAIIGPYKKAFYMYGGLDGTSNSSIETIGNWKGNNGSIGQKKYWAHPVFKIHDFSLLRERSNLESATHITAQFGLVFRMYQGGPGMFVNPCEYDKLRDVPSDAGAESGSYIQYNDVNREDQHSTTFPSLGWVSPDMRNTVDFYWHDPLHLNSSGSIDEELFGTSRILDISDVLEGDAVSGDKPAKRARKFRRGEDLSQPAEGDYDNETEMLLACEAKAARVRGWYTSTMIATVYASPSSVISSKWNIKAGDYKEANPTTGSSVLNRFYSEGSFHDNQFTLSIEPTGKILLNGKDDYESNDSASFKGASYLYNRAGETAHVISLVSGLPALRGHLPFWSGQAETITEPGYRVGLTTWDSSNRWLFPDAGIKGVPVWYQQYGNGINASNHYGSGALYSPSSYRGYSYSMTLANQYYGLPMTWMVNICSFKTDVYNPFDQQQLVWTGYYQRIENANLGNGAASDGSLAGIVNYYQGADSEQIFGGDTYITRQGVRTTSQSYGHSYFRAAQNLGDPVAFSLNGDTEGIIEDPGLADYLNGVGGTGTGITTKKDRIQGDIPAQLDPTKVNQNNRFGTTNGVPIWNWAATAAADASGGATAYDAAVNTLQLLKDTWNWVKGDVNPVSTLFYHYCESDDLIEFRHIKDKEKGEETKIFDYHNASSMIFEPPTSDYTDPDKLLYGKHFSAVQDVKAAIPLPVYAALAKENTFPRRVIRSDVDSGSLADGYRKFRALEYKDVPSQRGDIKSLFDYRNLLYIHTDRSLFMTQGKEELQIGAVNAFIGSGDIFTQDPSEVQETTIGYGGTSSRHCNVTTKHGHFYLNQRDRKIYMAGGNGIEDISVGMESWLREYLPYTIERYGINMESLDAENNGFYVDAPTGLSVPIGFTMGYDPVYDRVLITKHEPVPTQAFIDEFNSGRIIISNNIPVVIGDEVDKCEEPPQQGDGEGDAEDFSRQQNTPDGLDVFCGPIWFGNPKYFTQGGWTISYYPSSKIWGSRHSYLPNLYAHTSEQMISFAEGVDAEGNSFFGTWEHSNRRNPGRFYGTLYNFEIEYIDNTGPLEPKLFSTISYWAESLLDNNKNLTETNKVTNPVFTKYYAYNSTQITGLPTKINYLNNARLVDRMWHINDIRDYAKTQDVIEGDLITNTENVAGYITNMVTTHMQDVPMFSSEGNVNTDYVDTAKEWYNRRKLVDHFMGVRLIHDNSNRNLVHLYAVGTKFRKSYR